MIVLNLGCGTPDARSWHPIDGAINRDPGYDGWRFEHGLDDYADRSVDGVTISHAIMYLPLSEWPAFFAEVARVLRDGGVIRVTEDATDDTRSRTFKIGWHDHVTLTSASLVKRHLEAAGLVAHDCGPHETRFDTPILMQQQHGNAPHCFWVEGVRMTRVLFEPHADDAALFASFTILRYRPKIITCFGSSGDYGSTEARAAETRDAMSVLGGHSCEQWKYEWAGDQRLAWLKQSMMVVRQQMRPSLVFAPNVKASHPDHVAVALAAQEVFGDLLQTYHTYDESGRVREGPPVDFEPEWVHAKLRAMARYTSQATHPRACRFFLDDQNEFMG